MAKTKEITPQEYIDRCFYINKKGEPVSLQYIHRLLKAKKELPSVIKVRNYGRFYTLEVLESLLNN